MGRNDAAGVRSVAQRFAEKKDHLRQIRFFDEPVAPHRVNQGVSVHDGACVAQEFEKDIHRFRREWDDSLAVINRAFPTSDAVSVKFVHRLTRPGCCSLRRLYTGRPELRNPHPDAERTLRS